MQWVKQSIDQVLSEKQTDKRKGLSAEEAKNRLGKYGFNEFEEAKKESLFSKVFHVLTEITSIILLAAAAIAAWMAITEDDGGWEKVIVILAIVVINTCLSIYQENKAENALAALKKMNSFTTTVIRDGVKIKVPAREIVPGDIVELVAGDVITADARLIEAFNLNVEEAALTGESVPVEKDPSVVIEEDVPLGDRLNMVYSGCIVTNGRAIAVVVETAMETEMGKIAGMLNSGGKQQTPLQKRIKGLATKLSAFALLAGAAIFAVGFFRDGYDVPHLLLAAVSLGVAAVPETLPIIVTMTLSHGVWKMVRRNTIIRKIPAVETIGNTSVICSDKTGTLTQNKMSITEVWASGGEVCHTCCETFDKEAIECACQQFGDKELRLISYLKACSNAIVETVDGEERAIGPPTEVAIVRYAIENDVLRCRLDNELPRLHELPFDSTRKLMTTVHRTSEGKFIAITKGAFDRIPVDWAPGERGKAAEVHDGFAGLALRVLALSTKTLDSEPTPEQLTSEFLECGQTLVGLVGMIDPPRPESAEAVARAKSAGIKTVMITGDHIETAKAISREIGIYVDGDMALTGNDLNHMDDEELFQIVKKVSVYARVSPEDKMRIVKAWQRHDEVVAMTGDGVNDAPALKQADVGVAMGITGTEVTKSAADMVITDDNFATIVDAIEEGRTAYDNIRKTVYFLLAVNFAQIAIMLTSAILPGGYGGWPLPVILPLQILLINVIADGIPGFFLSFERSEDGIMKRKPLPKKAGIFAAGLGLKIGIRSITYAVLTLGAFAVGRWVIAPVSGYDSYGHLTAVGISMAFIILAWTSAFNVFNIRTNKSIFNLSVWKHNMGMILAVAGSMGITFAIAIIRPIAEIFDVAPLSGTHWAVLGGGMVLFVAISEVEKIIRKTVGKEVA